MARWPCSEFFKGGSRTRVPSTLKADCRYLEKLSCRLRLPDEYGRAQLGLNHAHFDGVDHLLGFGAASQDGEGGVVQCLELGDELFYCHGAFFRG